MCVDLLLAPMESTNRLVPASAMGMLWLQTHFADDTWELICSGKVNLNRESSESLYSDATAAGLSVSMLPSVVLN